MTKIGKSVAKSSKATKPQEKAKAKAEPKKVAIPKVSKAILLKAEKSANFNKAEAGSYDRLLEASRLVHLDAVTISQAFKRYVSQAKKVLTPKQMEAISFKSLCLHKDESKYKDLPFVSVHQVALMCNEILKKNDLNTARAIKAEKQQKAMDKKADLGK